MKPPSWMILFLVLAGTTGARAEASPGADHGVLPPDLPPPFDGRGSPGETVGSPPFPDASFPLIDRRHRHTRRLIVNAMRYLDPAHGLIDPASSYPVEGWNQDPERGLHLRTFTQLTAIGEWVELLATIAAGEAENDFVSRDQALDQLARVTHSLREDQRDPAIGAKGLLGNFLGLEHDRRLGPLAEEVEWRTLVDAFGEDRASAIWQALVEVEWIVPQRGGSEAKIHRGSEYGLEYFEGPLAPFADDETRHALMELLDQRVVQIVFGDNVNLSSSVAKAVGALLHPGIKDNPDAVLVRSELEAFLDVQKEGYQHLYDDETDTFIFGWTATRDRFVGWEDNAGNWVVGHQNYFINEFRGGLLFTVLRHELPRAAIRNAGFKIKPYRLTDGTDRYTLASWSGSAFQMLGLSLFMQELENPGWKTLLENTVAIEIDYANRHDLPGFLSESYSGRGVEYTGDVGIPDLAVTADPRITDAPSLYTLGVAYQVAPVEVEGFLAQHQAILPRLFSDHGPWEGYNTSSNQVIRFQTSAHTLSLILGLVGSGPANMRRYLEAHDLLDDLQALYQPGEACAFQALEAPPGSDVLRFGVTPSRGVNLSNGALIIGFRSGIAIDHAVLTLRRAPDSTLPEPTFANEVHLRFAKTGDAVRELRIPFPATPGLADIGELELVFPTKRPPSFTLTTLTYTPAAAE